MWDPTQPLGRMDTKWYQSKALDKGYTETTLVLGNTEKGTFKKQNLGTGLGPVGYGSSGRMWRVPFPG